MFEVIISNVKTGRVRRKSFATRDEADRHVARHEAKLTEAKKPRSLGDFRVEVRHIERPATQPAWAAGLVAA